MSAVIVCFSSFGARIQCAASKLADAVDTYCHREMHICRIGKNGRFGKSVPFPLKAGRTVFMDLKERNEKERKDAKERKE